MSTSFLFLHSLVKMLKFTSTVGYTSCGPPYIESFLTTEVILKQTARHRAGPRGRLGRHCSHGYRHKRGFVQTACVIFKFCLHSVSRTLLFVTICNILQILKSVSSVYLSNISTNTFVTACMRFYGNSRDSRNKKDRQNSVYIVHLVQLLQQFNSTIFSSLSLIAAISFE